MVGVGLTNAQSRSISGKVLSAENDEPIIGASVMVKGTSTGTITDFDGNFTVNVPSGSNVLVFSYVGMKTVEIEASNNMVVRLESATELLDEVMVVAYGTAKRSSFTGSAAVVKSEAIEKRQVSNITNALSGQVAGVQVTSSNGQPGSTSSIRVRGIGSMSASNTPLYVVDGVPYDGDISAINSADIDSYTVLKDAASNALYGARGANGVILITTKRGVSSKAQVRLDAKWGNNTRGVPGYDVMKDPAEYLTKVYEAAYNNQITLGLSPADAHIKANAVLPTNADGGIGYQIFTVPTGELLFDANGKMNSKATLGYSDGTYFYKPDDWYQELFDKGNLRQEYNVNVSGGSDKINYYWSAGYLDDSGIIANSGFTRYTTRLKADYQVKKWLKLNANVSYAHYDLQSPANQTSSGSSANLFYIANYIAPVYPLYSRDKNGDILIDSRGFTIYDFGDKTTGGNFKRTWMSGSNPASMLQLDKRNYLADVLSGRWGAVVDIIDGLQFTYNLGLDVDNTTYRRLYNAYYGQYSQVGGIVYAGATRTASINQQQLLTYKKEFGLHNVDVLLGHETYDYSYKYTQASKEKLYNPEVVEVDNGILSPAAYSNSDYYATEGYLFRAQYEYDGKYIVSGSYRRDASSRFHKDNRWGNFGSVGAAWVIDRENFMADVNWVNFLKFKISIGTQGNDKLLYPDGVYVNYYPYKDQYTLSESSGDFATVLDYKGNRDITWETSRSFNTGFDFNLFNSVLGGSIEYFSRKTIDMLYYRPVPMTSGYSLFPTNVGSVMNSGLELDLNATIIKKKNLNWRLTFNATFLQNKIIELSPELQGELISGTRIYREGESMYQLHLRNYAGVNDEGVALYYIDKEDANGNVTKETTTSYNEATRYDTGNILAKVYGGFGTSLDFYGFDFTASFAYQLGGRTFDGGYQSLMHGGSANNSGQNWHKDILNSWSATNNSDIPRVNSGDLYPNSTSDRFLISSNYLDITNIVLGYSLPKRLIDKIDISNLRVYFVADNVYLFSKRKGFDPRQSFTSVGAHTYSPIRTISGGLTITF